MAELFARAAIEGERVDLDFGWSGSGERARLRLVRKHNDPPASADDGLVIFDSADWFSDPEDPHATWTREERERYLVAHAVTEGGMAQAELSYFFVTGQAEPAWVKATLFDEAAQTELGFAIAQVARREVTMTPAGPSSPEQHTTRIFARLSGGGDVLAATLVVTARLGSAPARVAFTPAGADAVEGAFDWIERTEQQIRAEQLFGKRFVLNADELAPGALALRRTTLTEALDPRSGDWIRRLEVIDMKPSERRASPLLAGVAPERSYAYALFAARGWTSEQLAPALVFREGAWGKAVGTPHWLSEPDWTALCTPTARYALGDRLYKSLPAVHRNLDEPTAERAGRGELRRFLQIFGGGLDQIRSRAQAMATRHDPYQALFTDLPRLAKWIGWEPDETVSGRLQRNDLLMAPAIFQSLGTIPTLRAIVNRVTPFAANSGWQIQVKEFANNVMLTNAVEPIRPWELWQSESVDATTWTAVRSTTSPEAFDGRPCVVEVAGVTWLIWHSDRSGRRELWFQRLGVDNAPRRVMQTALDDSPSATFSDEYPAVLGDGAQVRVFWSSNRHDNWDVWTRLLSDAGPGPASRVTDGIGDNRNPALARVSITGLLLVWQSNRRGPTDLWQGSFDLDAPAGSPLRQISRRTSSDGFDILPALVVADAGVRCFFTRASSKVAHTPSSDAALEILDAASASNAAPIAITTRAAHGFVTGQVVSVADVRGNVAANGTWTLTRVDPTHFLLDGSRSSGSYAGGGTLRVPAQFVSASGNTCRIFAGPEALSVVTASQSSPIVIETNTPHRWLTGQSVTIAGVLGNTAANGSWFITVIDSTRFSLDTSVGNLEYVAGGTASGVVDIFAAADAHMPVTERARIRDEAPTATTPSLGAPIRLFWHSNRGGRWRIWSSVESASGWSTPAPVNLGVIEADKDPALIATSAGDFKLFFRSQRSGRRFRSRTVDTNDLGAVQRGNVADQWHYVYDCARDKTNWYARDAVGIYLSPPDPGDASAHQANRELVARIRDFVQPFRPVTARLVWLYQFDKPTPI